MTIQEFKQLAKVTEINTLNGWGFGGELGKQWNYKDIELKECKYSTRHNGTYPSVCYKVGTEYFSTKEQFILAIKTKQP